MNASGAPHIRLEILDMTGRVAYSRCYHSSDWIESGVADLLRGPVA